MKTIPIIDLSRCYEQNALHMEYLRQNREKTNKVLLIKIPEQEPKPMQLIIEKRLGDIGDLSEKIKKLNKEILGI